MESESEWIRKVGIRDWVLITECLVTLADGSETVGDSETEDGSATAGSSVTAAADGSATAGDSIGGSEMAGDDIVGSDPHAGRSS